MIINTSNGSLEQPTLLQNGILSPFWEIKIVLVETNDVVIRMVEKILENTKVLHFLRRIDNPHDLQFELKYNKPNLILSGRTMENFSAIDVLDLTKLYDPEMPVIVLAPDYKQNESFNLIEHGAYDIIYHQELKRLPNEVAFLSEGFKKKQIA